MRNDLEPIRKWSPRLYLAKAAVMAGPVTFLVALWMMEGMPMPDFRAGIIIESGEAVKSPSAPAFIPIFAGGKVGTGGGGNGNGGAAQYRAFPEAEGFAAMATWNADSTDACNRPQGQTLTVSNTNDSGAGSLRQAVADMRPDSLDVVIVTTGGTVTLASELLFEGESCGIFAFHTAPGGGFQLYRNNATVVDFQTETTSHDLVFRYLRARADSGTSQRDAVRLLEGDNIIFDHCSISFGTDEGFSLTTLSTASRANADSLENITAQRCIIGPGLRPHSTGSLIGGPGDRTSAVNYVSIHHNLYIHNAHRNPVYQDSADGMQWINNVVYNCRNWNSGSSNALGQTNFGPRIDYSRNYYKSGPWAVNCDDEIHRETGDPADNRQVSLLWVNKNVVDSLGTLIADSTVDLTIDRYVWSIGGSSLPGSAFVGSRQAFPQVPVTESHAVAAYDTIATDADVGAWQKLNDSACDGTFIDARDALDDTLIAHVQNNTGPSIDTENDSPNDYGGIPTLAAGTACTDTDSDGMPDVWEDANSLDKNSAADNFQDADTDGYTNIEEYLNGTDPQVSG